MRKSSAAVAVAFSLALAGGGLAVALAASVAEAQTPSHPGTVGTPGSPRAAGAASASAHSTPADAEPVGANKFMELCVEGNRKFLTGDYAGALEVYRAAQHLAPKNPFGHYLIAEANLALGNLDEEERALTQALAVVDRKQEILRSKVLFLMADLKERQQKWDEAKAAWTAYQEWVMKSVDAGGTFPLTAAARIKLTDEAMRRDATYALVRERIDASAGGTVYNTPPAPSAKTKP